MWFVDDSPYGFYWLSGLKHIVRKFQRVEDDVKYPTGFLWAIGLYFAIFGLSDQLYQGELNRLKGRIDQVRDGVVSANKNYWFEQIAPLQNSQTRIPPWPPTQTIQSFLGVREKNPAMIKELIDIVQSPSADLRGASLSGIDLKGANLTRANLVNANLKDANLEGVNLEDANLKDANLEGANLTEGKLYGVRLNRAKLLGAKFNRAKLGGARLNGAELTMADFREANLGDADLKDAVFCELAFDCGGNGAYFTGVNLQKSKNLTCNQMYQMDIDGATTPPDHLTIKWENEWDYTCKEN